jgi:adenosylcobinamide kinase / adenosylcobinamide-phosphate guanylyltransferase
MVLPKLSLVLGGAASGKSVFAENLITSSGLTPVYIATAQVWDAEMAAKIAAHKLQRGPGWRLIEEPLALDRALAGVMPGDAVLIDCATLWLTNLILTGADVHAAEAGLLAALQTCPAPVVIVSNEVSMGIVPDNALARQFRIAQGGLNQRLAAQADLAVMVVAGLPMVLKGQLP